MDKIYLKMLEGSTYIYRTEPWVEKPTKYEVGDYLLSDLETIVKQSLLTEDQKADVVGICIGENPVNHKNVFWYVDCFSQNSDDGTFVKDGYYFLSDDDSIHWYKYDTGNLLLKDGTIYPWRKFVKDPTSMPAQEDVAGICVANGKDTEFGNSLILLGKCNASLINAGDTTTTFFAVYDPDHDEYSDDSDLSGVLRSRKESVLATLSGDNLTTYTQSVDKFTALVSWCDDHSDVVDIYAYVASIKPALEMHNALINNQNFIRMATAHPWLYDFLLIEEDSTLYTISLQVSHPTREYTPTNLDDDWGGILIQGGVPTDEGLGVAYNNFSANCYIYTYANNDEDSSNKIEDGILNIYYKEEDNGKNPWKPDMDVNTDVITGMPGYITSTRNYNDWDSDEHCCVNDFAGKQNTIEWYKQMTAAGYNVATDMPALKALMDINGVESLDDDFDGWFLGSTGYMNLIASFWGNYSEEKSAEAQELRNKFNASLKNLNLERFADSDDPLNDLSYSDFWGSTFCRLDSSYSDVHTLGFYLGGSGIYGYDVDNGDSLFAIIER